VTSWIASSVTHEESGRAFRFHRVMDHARPWLGPSSLPRRLELGWELRSVSWLAPVPGLLSVLAVLLVALATGAAVAAASSAALIVWASSSHDRVPANK
jgi:hypothetical protein